MKRIISVLIAVVLVCSTVVFAHPFSDVKGHWAESEIEKGYANKAINGDPDGRFRPDDNITRAEFLKMLTAGICKRAGVEIPQEFDDGAHWASMYHNFANFCIYKAMDTQVEGVNPGIMKTAAEYDMPISRWEMAFMLAQAAENVIGIKATGEEANLLKDADKISANFPKEIVAAISTCNEFALMSGDDKSLFNPSAKGTRAEAITVVNRFDNMLVEVIETANREREEANAEYEKKITESLVTYTDIPKGHPTATILMDNNKKIVIELYPEYAPQTVANFVKLAKDGFYNGLTFHRIVEKFMAQGGDPSGDGTGGAGHYIVGEFSGNNFEKNTLSHTRGVISMARSQHNNSASSQFFICYDDASFLDGQYAAFGKVTSGMDVVDAFLKVEMTQNSIGENASPKTPIVIKSITIK